MFENLFNLHLHPKTMKIFIQTYGCTLNQSDSEVMAGLLSQEGHKIVKTEDQADLVIINTCTVKDPAEKKCLYKLRHLKKPVVITGCVPQADINNELWKKYSVVGVKQLKQIAYVAEETLKGNVVHFFGDSKDQRLNLPKVRKNDFIEIIPLCCGCLGECSYCKTRHARGSIVSYKPSAIIKQLKTALKEGIKEFHLTSQDNGAYGLDINTNLPELLRSILAIKGDFRIRLGMINPEHTLVYLDQLIKIYQHEKMFKFLHLPVQSGSNKILKLMKRKYKKEDFIKIVNAFKKAIPELTLATDVICGFPGESESDFSETVEILKKTKPSILNISKFFSRPGTQAAILEQEETGIRNTKIKKKRSKVIHDLSLKLRQNDSWMGWQGEVLVDDIGKYNSLIARNDFYKLVIIKKKGYLGKKIKVKIIETHMDYLVAEILTQKQPDRKAGC